MRWVKGPFTQVRTLRLYARNMGWTGSLRIRFYDLKTYLKFRMPAFIDLRVNNAIYPLRMRTGTSSDRQVLNEIFASRDYDPIELIQPAAIIDLGANVGYSSAYFLSKYPSATVIAVEPDPENIEICRHNLEPFGKRATLICGAAWPEESRLELRRGVFGDGREWATQVCERTAAMRADSTVQGYEMNSLLDLSGATEIDLLKIDIEGSERELFSRGTDGWLRRVKNICIELHGEECAKMFFSALSGYAYDLSRAGGLTICSNIRATTAPARQLP